MGKLGNDGEPEPGPRLCLIEPLPPLHGPLPFCLELGNADALAASHPDVAAQIRSFPVPAS